VAYAKPNINPCTNVLQWDCKGKTDFRVPEESYGGEVESWCDYGDGTGETALYRVV